MNDYIMSRESLKRHCEAMCNAYKAVPTSGTYSEHRLVLDLLEQTEWIPVSEKLPEIGQRILVTYNQEDEVKIDITDYTKHGFLLSVVKAWMPLPQSYKAEKEENVCKDCYYNDGEVHAECVICGKAESEINNDDA